MTVMNPVQSEVILPPGPPANGNGAGTVHPDVVQAAVQAADAEAERRLAMIGQLGRAIERKERERDKQETVVASKKSDFEEARDVFNQHVREINEMKDELVLLSTGKSSERLPFGENAQNSAGNAQAAPGSDDALQAAFDKMPLAEIGVKPALADKLVADGIRNGRELRDWFSQVPQRKIPGVGPKAVEGLNELMAVKMLALQEQMKYRKSLAQGLSKIRHVAEDGSSLEFAKYEDGSFDVLINGQLIQYPDRAISDRARRELGIDAEAFDDAAIKEGTIQGVASVPGLLLIQVGQRNGGQWSHRYSLTPTPVKEPEYTQWAGAFPTMQEAAVDAADLIDESLPKKGLKGQAAKDAAAIRRELDRMERSFANRVN